jgi:hypothetical protein
MTNVDIVFRYALEPREAQLLALSGMREVYGIRHLTFDRDAKTVRVEYDATRLTGPVVAGLIRRAGVEILEEMPLIPPPAPALEAAAAPASAPAAKA